MPAAGTKAIYRPCPRDFEEVFVRHGWRGAEDILNAHGYLIKRWLEENGRERIVKARQAYRIANRKKSTRYAMGRRLIAVVLHDPSED